jgi:hypothetical protein
MRRRTVTSFGMYACQVTGRGVMELDMRRRFYDAPEFKGRQVC